MKKISFVLICCSIIQLCAAQNPVVQTHYTPDPAPMVYKDRVYMFTGDDLPGYDFYYMTRWRVFSSADMVNWTNHGSPITLESFTWARDRAWAAQCIARNGRFYWYICAQTVDNNMAVGVAVADKPEGPYKDALGKPLISTGSWSNIDPTVMIDDDGQAYLYWGNGSLYYVRLNQDMISYSDTITEVPQTEASFGGIRRRNNGSNASNSGGARPEPPKDVYVEGPWLFKRNSLYYLMYAGMTNRDECLSYATATSPVGPWKYGGKIMTGQPTNSFTNHGGIIDFKGNSYLFYHTGWLPGGGSYGRASSIEQFSFNPDGSIPAITATKTGVEPVATLNPYNRTEAETMAWSQKCSTAEMSGTGVYVTGTRTGGYIKVRAVDFGNSIPKTFTASLAAGLDGGILEVHADSVQGTRLAVVELPRTGGWQTWQSFTVPVENTIQGTHDLYLVFKGKNISAGRELFNFDYWRFGR